jgi:hypothetical protein
MKNQSIVVIAIAFALAFALASVTQANITLEGGPAPANAPAATASSTSPVAVDVPVITIHSTDNVIRGKTGSFVLATTPAATVSAPRATFVNFNVSGTAVAGIDYVALVSPAFIAASGFGVISLKTLPDPRGSFIRQAYSVVVTLEPGAGYAVGEPSSAVIWIKP